MRSKKKENKLKTLSIAALTGSIMLGVPAFADEANHIYTLTKVDTKGANTVTKFEYNENTKSIEPVYYQFDLKKTSFGSGSNTKIYEFQSQTIGDPEYPIEDITQLVEVEVPTSGKLNIKYNYDKLPENLNKPAYDIDNYSSQENINISGDFVGYTQSGNRGSVIEQGSLSKSSIDVIDANFIGNKGSNVIRTFGKINTIKGNFIGNYGPNAGGAVHVDEGAQVNEISANFIGNSSNSFGSAIYNEKGSSPIDKITGDFIGNETLFGGTIANLTGINTLNGDFIGNKAAIVGGVLLNAGSYVNNINGNFIGNQSTGNLTALIGPDVDVSLSFGGAIVNYNSTIGNLSGDFINNSTKGNISGGGAIANCFGNSLLFRSNINGNNTGSIIKNINGNFINNTAGTGSAIVNANFAYYEPELPASVNYMTSDIDKVAKIGNIQGNFIGNKALVEKDLDGQEAELANFLGAIVGVNTDKALLAKGGAIHNYKGSIDTITNSRFINNSAISIINGIEAQGGAIRSTEDITLVSDNGLTEFTGNYIKNADGVIDNQAIYIANKDAKLTFSILNNGRVIQNDNINGEIGYTVNIIGDSSGVFGLYNDIYNANVNVGNTTLNTINNDIHIYNFNSFTINSNTNMVADVDLANEQMDSFAASSYGEHLGSLNVIGMNLLSDGKTDTTEVYFAETGLKDNVTTSVKELQALTPIYKYTVNYANREDGGYFVFNRGANGGSSASDSFNPAVLAGPVAAQSGALSVATQTFNYAFQNSDNFMNIPYLERIAMKNENKYALSPTGEATDMGTYSPLFTKNENSSVWVKPYASFENVPLKNGPKVSNITYGTLVGYDTDLIPMKNGWDKVWTGYIGYNGASQRYSGVDSTQNGGLLGGTLTLYKGNFFNATTISAGANVGSNQTMYGHENLTMLLAGIGNKTGYNFEFKEGRIIIQPSLMMSYTFVNTFDYTNAAGVKVKSDPLHALQLAPGVKFIGNTKNGWQPYIGVNMVWNLMDKSDVTANGVKLPEMSIKPYVQYGVGVQKRFKDNCMAYGQAMLQNGGRNGISLTGGFRWALGRHGANRNEKVQTDAPKKIVKQMTPSQKTALIKSNYTTRTLTSAFLKQL